MTEKTSLISNSNYQSTALGDDDHLELGTGPEHKTRLRESPFILMFIAVVTFSGLSGCFTYHHGELKAQALEITVARDASECAPRSLSKDQTVCCFDTSCAIKGKCTSNETEVVIPPEEGICECENSSPSVSDGGKCIVSGGVVTIQDSCNAPSCYNYNIHGGGCDGYHCKDGFPCKGTWGSSLSCCKSCYGDNGGGAIGGGCFSSKSEVNILGKGITPIRQVQIGDYLESSPDGTYSKVFMFHRNIRSPTEFYQIQTTSRLLELTKRHMLYTAGKRHPKSAKDIQVGETLVASGGGIEEVIGISKVFRNEFFDPVTENGKVVVNGFVASSYTSLSKASLFHDNIFFHSQTISEVATAPLRFTCKAIWPSFCTKEAFLDDEGMHQYVTIVKKARDLNYIGQFIFAPFLLGSGILFSGLEYFYDNKAMSCSVALAYVTYRNKGGVSVV